MGKTCVLQFHATYHIPSLSLASKLSELWHLKGCVSRAPSDTSIRRHVGLSSIIFQHLTLKNRICASQLSMRAINNLPLFCDYTCFASLIHV